MGLFDDVSFDHMEMRVKEYPLPGCFVRSAKEVVLLVQHAGAGNAGWENAVLSADAAKPLADCSSREVFEAMLPALASHVVTGWREVNDKNGQPLPYSAAAFDELMRRYAEKAFDQVERFMVWARKERNFRDYTPPKIDGAALGKE